MKIRLQIKKLHPQAVIPSYAKPGDAGMDLTSVHSYMDENGRLVVHTGIAVKIPDGFVGLIFPRSSISKKHLALTNSVGVIDSGYTGEILFKFAPTPHFNMEETYGTDYGDMISFYPGDRVGQLIVIPYPEVLFEEVEELPKTDRGEDGFGSSGN